ncbi:MAG: tyrosine-type recombinase/integrase [Syntrophobacteraceae bacterium]
MNDRKHPTITHEVEKLMAAAKGSRFEARDRCLLLMMFGHGLRVSEACALQLEQVEIESHVVHLARLKKGLSTTHPLRADGGAARRWLPPRRRSTATRATRARTA